MISAFLSAALGLNVLAFRVAGVGALLLAMSFFARRALDHSHRQRAERALTAPRSKNWVDPLAWPPPISVYALFLIAYLLAVIGTLVLVDGGVAMLGGRSAWIVLPAVAAYLLGPFRHRHSRNQALRSLRRGLAVTVPIILGVLAGMAAFGTTALWAPPSSWQFRPGLGLASVAIVVAAVPLATSPLRQLSSGLPVARYVVCPIIAALISLVAIALVLAA